MTHAPQIASVLWPDAETGPWCVTVWWRIQYGVPTPVGLAITSWNEKALHAPYSTAEALPAPDADTAFPRLEGQVLRQLPMTELLALTREVAQQRLASWDVVVAAVERSADLSRRLAELAPDVPQYLLTTDADVARVKAAKASADEQRAALGARKGSRDLGDEHYRQVAATYAAAVQAGLPPTLAVARWLAGPEASNDLVKSMKSAAAKQVSRARLRGFLPTTTRGRAGRLTEAP